MLMLCSWLCQHLVLTCFGCLLCSQTLPQSQLTVSTCLGCEFRRLREGLVVRDRAQTRVKLSPSVPVVVSQFEAEVICRSYKPFYPM